MLDRIALQDLALPALVAERDTLAILAANDAALRHFGYTAGELLALTLGDICPEIAAPRDAIDGDSAFSPGPVPHRAKNGSTTGRQTYWQSMRFDGRPVFLCLLLEADRPGNGNGAETPVPERNGTLPRDDAIPGSRIASHIKDEFLATLSHELRTPLNAILGWTQTLQNGSTRKETLLRALRQIEQSAQAQAKLIDELLNVSDIVAGRLRLEVQPMRLVSAINAAIETLYPAINAKDIRLDTSFDLSADVISGDPVRIRQIVWNLLSNAVKFTPPGGRVTAHLTRNATGAQISVADTGEGISPDFLPFVFDRFRQADASSRKRHGGLGLGLAIVRHLAELHGGTVHAYSEGKGQGSTFTVHLPVRAVWEMPPATAVADTTSAASRARRHKLTGLRILAVDDDRNTREMLQEALERAGARVEAAGSARDALEKLKRFHPDVLLSDIGMPDEDGYDLLRQIRNLPDAEGGLTPAIALTGYARDEDQAATRAAGYQAVTAKPINLDDLLAIITDVAQRPAG